MSQDDLKKDEFEAKKESIEQEQDLNVENKSQEET